MPLYLLVLGVIALLDVRLILFPPIEGEGMLVLLVIGVPLLSFLGVRSAVRSAQGESDLARLTCGASFTFLALVCLRKALMHIPSIPPLLLGLVFLNEVRLLGAAVVNVFLALPLFLKSPKYAVASFLASVAGLQLFFLQGYEEFLLVYAWAVVWLAGSFSYSLLWGAAAQPLVQKLFRSPK